jgi:hypothetical protein
MSAQLQEAATLPIAAFTILWTSAGGYGDRSFVRSTDGILYGSVSYLCCEGG